MPTPDAFPSLMQVQNMQKDKNTFQKQFYYNITKKNIYNPRNNS